MFFYIHNSTIFRSVFITQKTSSKKLNMEDKKSTEKLCAASIMTIFPPQKGYFVLASKKRS